MLRICTRVTVIAFLFIAGLWLTIEAYGPDHRSGFPWIAATSIALTAGAAAALWYRRHPPTPRWRRGDPGE